MPGVVQHTRDSLRRAAADAVAAGVGGLMLFGVPRDDDKDSTGSAGAAAAGAGGTATGGAATPGGAPVGVTAPNWFVTR